MTQPPEPAYTIGDKVWRMQSNKPVESEITGVVIWKAWQDEVLEEKFHGEVAIEYQDVFLDYSPDKVDGYDVKELFPTKQDLIKSL